MHAYLYVYMYFASVVVFHANISSFIAYLYSYDYCPVGGGAEGPGELHYFPLSSAAVLPRQCWDESPPDEGLDAVDGGDTARNHLARR